MLLVKPRRQPQLRGEVSPVTSSVPGSLTLAVFAILGALCASVLDVDHVALVCWLVAGFSLWRLRYAAERPGWDRRRLREAAATVALTVALVVALLTAAGENGGMPRVARLGDPLFRVLGTEQSWDMFAPHPLATSVSVVAVVGHPGGDTVLWRPPGSGAVSAYRNYRWVEWQNEVHARGSAFHRSPCLVAEWYRRQGLQVSDVTVFLHERPVVPGDVGALGPAPFSVSARAHVAASGLCSPAVGADR